MLFSENWGKVSIKHFSLCLVICYFFPPSLLSSRPVLPFAALLLFVYLTLFLIPFTIFTNQYLILCLCPFWFCPFMSSYTHLLTPVFLLIHFLWLPFHLHTFRKPLMQVQYIDLLLFHILVLPKTVSAVVHCIFCSSETFQKLHQPYSIAFLILNLNKKLFFLTFLHSCRGVWKIWLTTLFGFHGRAGIIWNMHNLIRIARCLVQGFFVCGFFF